MTPAFVSFACSIVCCLVLTKGSNPPWKRIVGGELADTKFIGLESVYTNVSSAGVLPVTCISVSGTRGFDECVYKSSKSVGPKNEIIAFGITGSVYLYPCNNASIPPALTPNKITFLETRYFSELLIINRSAALTSFSWVGNNVSCVVACL